MDTYTATASAPQPESHANVWAADAQNPAASAPLRRRRMQQLDLGSFGSRRGLATLAVVALTAGLVGGGVGAAAFSQSDSAGPATGSSSISRIVNAAAPVIAPEGTAQAVAAKVAPSVVSIDVRNATPSSGLLRGNQGGVAGSGSGVVIGSDGLILTNNHVAGEGDLTVTFSDGRSVRATLIKADPVTDLAVIKAQGVTDATPIAWGRSDSLVVGQAVYAMGSPLGLSGTFTSGIVSALHRPVVPQAESGSGTNSVIDAIQTDAPINPGNSGGALVDAAGNLVGITSAIASLGGAQSGSIGLGFAIPVDQARVVAEQLANGVTVAHGQLGVQVGDSTDPSQRGAQLQRVTAGGAADQAGLRAGDVVTGFDGRLLEDGDSLVAAVRSAQPNTRHTVTYVRDGATNTATVTLGSDAVR
ncbi:MAG: S1C family serine protease [Sporichthyaceae bacterium]